VKLGTRFPPSDEAIINAAAANAWGVKAPERMAGSRSATSERTSTCRPAT
jgi:hypothetical protein